MLDQPNLFCFVKFEILKIFRAHLESLLHYVETGVKEGAKLVYGGKRLDRKGKLNFKVVKILKRKG